MTTEQSRAELFLSQELGVSDLSLARTRLAASEIALVISRELAEDRLAQITFLAAANILCRLGPYCPAIAVSAPQVARVAPGVPLLPAGAPLAPALCQFMTEVQRPADRSARRYRVAGPAERFDLAFAIGSTNVLAGRTLYAWYERWTGGFRSTPRPSRYHGPNPFGALLAGMLGATAVSRLLLARVAAPESSPQPLPSEAALSAYSYGRPDEPAAEPDLPAVVDLRPAGPTLLVGGGAVASGVAFALASLGRAAGTLDVVDDDALDATNLERHLISVWTDVGAPKARRLAEVFGNGAWNGLHVHPRICRYEALPPQPWPTLIAAVDRPDPRRRLQFDLPRVLLNAGTVGSEFLVSRHDYGAGPCAECLYPERPAAVKSPTEILAAQTGLSVGEILDLQATGAPVGADQLSRIADLGGLVFPPDALSRAAREDIGALAGAACTTAVVRPSQPVATIGFVAALPGLLLAAELIKEAAMGALATGRPPLSGNRNIFRMDTFGGLADELEHAKSSRGCRCRDKVMQAAYHRRWTWAANA